MRLKIKTGHTPKEEGRYFWVGKFGTVLIVNVVYIEGFHNRCLGVAEMGGKNVELFKGCFSTKIEFEIDKPQHEDSIRL